MVEHLSRIFTTMKTNNKNEENNEKLNFTVLWFVLWKDKEKIIGNDKP